MILSFRTIRSNSADPDPRGAVSSGSSLFAIPFASFGQIKAVFSEENYVPQPSSFVGYIENYGIKLWRPFKQQFSMGRNGHRPKWLWAEMTRNLYII